MFDSLCFVSPSFLRFVLLQQYHLYLSKTFRKNKLWNNNNKKYQQEQEKQEKKRAYLLVFFSLFALIFDV